MKILFHAFFILVCLVCDTARPPFFPPFGIDIDLSLFYVIFAALSRPHAEAAVVAAVLGIGMDSYSGAAFGLHFTVYLWIVFALAWIPSYADVENGLFIALAVACGVLAQGAFFSVAASFMADGGQRSAPTAKDVAAAAAVAAPLGYIAISKLKSLFTKLIGLKDRSEPRVYIGDITSDRLD